MARSRTLFVAGILGALFSVTACSSGNNGTHTKCGAGTHNSAGVCLPDEADGGVDAQADTQQGTDAQQDASADAQQDATTDAGTDGGGTAKGNIGDSCTTGSDCLSSTCADTSLDPGLTGGYCTILGCNTTNKPCPAGSTCIDPGAGVSLCFATCDPGTHVCRSGYVCQPDLAGNPGKGFCAPQCTKASDCPAGAVCDTADGGYCSTPPTCDPASPSCASGTTCTATSQSSTGGFCFPDCTSISDCKSGEVCQPTAAGSSAGVCVPPPCTGNNDCPVGATCVAQASGLDYCAPPKTCTGSCSDSTTSCVGGYCLPKCSGSTSDADCAAIQTGLTCNDAAGVCMPACGAGGTCDAGSTCFDAQNVCMPTGGFPGSPCLPADSSHTSPYCLPVGGAGSVTQSCIGGACVVDCDDAATSTGDGLCASVDSALTCMPTSASGTAGSCVYACFSGQCQAGYACYDPSGQNACLPVGSFPSSPCKLNGSCDNYGALGMSCYGGICLVDCTDATGGDTTVCPGVDPALTCEDTFTHACLIDCTATSGACPSGMTCYSEGSHNACLPTGSYPGSPCRSTSPKCDSDVGGDPTHDLVCANAGGGPICLFDCTWDATVCSGIPGMTTCTNVGAGSVCTP